MVNIVLTQSQLKDIQDQQNGAPAPVDPGLPSTRPEGYNPPPVTADVTVTHDSIWPGGWLANAKGLYGTFNDLSQGGIWNVRLINADNYNVMGATRWGNQQALGLRQLGAEKTRWSGQGYDDIQAKLDALQNVQDSDLMWFPESIRHETIYDQPWVAGDYILEVTDERGQVLNVTFTQGASPMPTGAVFYTAQAGPTRRVYSSYTL